MKNRILIAATLATLLLLAGSGIVVSQVANNRTPNAFTGTYQLDAQRSDNLRARIESATSGIPADKRQDVRKSLTDQLRSADKLAIDQRDQKVTIASTLAPTMEITADGRNHETNGATSTTEARFSGKQLIIDAKNEGGRDYSITIDPLEDGGLRLTRTIWAKSLKDPLVVTSVYKRTSDGAELNLFDRRGVELQPKSAGGNYQIPSGAKLYASLDKKLDTKETKDNDRFSLTVTTPNTYNGAVIDGHLESVKRSGPFTGRSEMKFQFDRIQLQNGHTYDFAANIDSVRLPGGDEVSLEEGTVGQKEGQTEETVKHTGVGAALGAVIGAIAGGGKGAAIGAVVGAGAGAGSVYVTGHDLELPEGTQFVLEAVNPNS